MCLEELSILKGKIIKGQNVHTINHMKIIGNMKRKVEPSAKGEIYLQKLKTHTVKFEILACLNLAN